MRLRRLDLTRFGHFTEFSLDFGPRENGRPDLHIIFGPNEAGKTTSFEGYLDLLFGIPTRSKYNFLHDYETMRVGAVLEIDGNPTELIRIKRNKNDLITPSGDLANSALLTHALDGIDREQYQAMFSLDDETIEQGGEDILASQGNLGELLFSAAAGLSDLGTVLEAAREDIDRFHKPRARKSDLAEAKRQLQELHHEIRELDVPASAFRHLKEDRDQAQNLLDSAKQHRDALLEEKARLTAMIDCIPLMQSYQSAKKNLEGFATYPNVPQTWRDEAQSLKLAQVEAETELRQAKQQLTDFETARDKLDMDARVIEVAEDLTVLLDAPKSRAQTADEDLPKREAELDGLREEIAGLADELKLDAPQNGALGESRLEQLAGIASDYTETKSALSAAKKEHADAALKLENFNEGAEPADLDLPSRSDLEDLLSKLEPEQRISDLEKTSESVFAAEAELRNALDRLSPWTGDQSDLLALTLTEERAKRIAERWADLLEKRDAARTALHDAKFDYDKRNSRLKASSEGNAAAIHKDATLARSERDALWSAHLENLTPNTATAFEEAMSKDDALQDARLGVAEQLARLKELQIDVAEAKTAWDSRSETLKAAESDLAAEHERIVALLAELGLPQDYDPRDLPAWQSRLLTAKERQADLKAKTKAETDTRQAVADTAAQIRKALDLSDETMDLKALNKRARAELGQALKAQAKTDAQRDALKMAQQDVQRREKDMQQTADALTQIQSQWEAAVTDLPAALQDLDQFHWKVSTLRKLTSKAIEQGQLERRIKAMRDNQDTFSAEVSKLAHALEQPVEANCLVTAERLKTRLDKAKMAQSTFEDLTDKIEAAQSAVLTAETSLSAIKDRLVQMAEPFGEITDIENLDDLIEALNQAIDAEQLRKQAESEQTQILARLGASDLQAAQTLLGDHDVPSLEAKRDGVAKDLDEAEAEYAEKVGDLRAAKDALEKVGGDGTPARLEEKRQTLLLDLEDRAKEALRLRLGILAAEHAISNYRDAHRSKMLADTEQAFSTLTGGEYHDLRTQSDGHKEVLLALRQHDGRSITVSEMSKGTRFQLYLALRLAGYRQYTASGTTLPFVADDIMETFDNSRTSAALGLLREIAQQGQALYFTHHEHVVELAREVCGDDVTVHKL